MKPEEYNEELLEESEYSKKSDFSKATLTSTQVERCLTLRSKDMRPGYTTFAIDRNGDSHPQIVTDTRKEFVSSVEALKNLLSPEIKSVGLKIDDDFEENKKNLFDKYAYHERLYKKTNSEGKNIWVYSGNVFLPQKGYNILDNSPKYPLSKMVVKLENGWDHKINAYWDEMVLIADKLFQELNELIHKLEYFKGGSSF